MDFSKQIRYVHKPLELDQKQLADALNASLATISRKENLITGALIRSEGTIIKLFPSDQKT